MTISIEIDSVINCFQLISIRSCTKMSMFSTSCIKGKIRMRNVKVLIITARNEVGARLCFHRRVWFCSQGGVCLSACWDTPLGSRHPWAEPPWSRHPLEQTPPGRRHPPPGSRNLPRADSPQSRNPLEQIPPSWEQAPPGSRHPPEANIPLEQTPPQSRDPPSRHSQNRHPPRSRPPREQTPPWNRQPPPE